MYTLKIKQTRWSRERGGEPTEVTTTDFIPADSIRVGEEFRTFVEFTALREKYDGVDREVCDRLHRRDDDYESITFGRLVRVVHGDSSAHYAVSLAWLLGENGSTIERIAP